MQLFATIISSFQKGGIFMYPILALFLLGIVIAIDRFIYLQRAGSENTKLWKRLMPLVNQGDYEQAERVASKSSTPIGRVLGYGIATSRNHATREQVELAMEESLMEITPLLERRTHYLSVFANVATLLGLLGTIMGLIHGFSAVAGVNPAEKADQLSKSVSEAMNCTAFCLLTAIPFMLLHSWLSTKTEELVDSVEMAAAKFLNSFAA